MIKRKSKSGQSILEYTLLLGVVIAIIVTILLGVSGQGGMRQTIGDAYNKTGEALNETATNLTGGLFQ